MCLSADTRHTYDISPTRIITLQHDGGDGYVVLENPIKQQGFVAYYVCIDKAFFKLFAVLQIICSKVHSQGTYVIQHHYLTTI